MVDPSTLEDADPESVLLERYDDHHTAAPCPFCGFLGIGCCPDHAMDRLLLHLDSAHRVGHA